MNIDNIIKNLQQQIKSIKESNKNEMNNEILQIKKKYADKTLAKKLETDFEIFKNGINKIVKYYYDNIWCITDDFIDDFFDEMEFEFEYFEEQN